MAEELKADGARIDDGHRCARRGLGAPAPRRRAVSAGGDAAGRRARVLGQAHRGRDARRRCHRRLRAAGSVGGRSRRRATSTGSAPTRPFTRCSGSRTAPSAWRCRGSRASACVEIVQTQPFLRARVEEVPDIMPAPGDLETEALTRNATDALPADRGALSAPAGRARGGGRAADAPRARRRRHRGLAARRCPPRRSRSCSPRPTSRRGWRVSSPR